MDPVSVVREFTQKLHSPDTRPEALRLLDDAFVILEPPELPYGGEYHGPDGFVELITRLRDTVIPTPLGPRTLRTAGDRVLLHDAVRFTSRTTGRSAEMEVAELYTVRDGKIVKADIYYKDPAAVAALTAP